MATGRIANACSGPGGRVENGINLKVIWFDEVEDLLELLFSCSNGYFSGQAEIYVTRDVLSKLANGLNGFPSCPNDSREFELGTFNPEHADGGVRMHFHALDSVGHAAVDVKLRGDACKALGEIESVALRIPIEAAAVDNFIRQLRTIDKTTGAGASLHKAK
jgi:hypothetical protein